VERAIPGFETGAREDGRPEALQFRAAAQREQSIAIVDAIRAWAFQQRPLPESSLGKAIAYTLGLWPELTRFLGDARIPLDNSATERARRRMVVGSKNHYGSRSERNTEVAALSNSLLESAKLCGVNPQTYLLAPPLAALTAPGTALLPPLASCRLPWGSASSYGRYDIVVGDGASRRPLYRHKLIGSRGCGCHGGGKVGTACPTREGLDL
jgi:hypothetical protein